jgi:hypothetical protein
MRFALLAVVIFVASVATAQRVLLSDITAFTFTRGHMTAARRVSAMPQLTCRGGALCEYAPDVVRCKPDGHDGVTLAVRCEAEMAPSLRFGSLDVSCEGYSDPDDPFVLAGSCGLTYELLGEAPRHAANPPPVRAFSVEQPRDDWTFHTMKQAPPPPEVHHHHHHVAAAAAETSDGGAAFAVILLLSVIGVGLYLCCIVAEQQQQQRTTPPPPPPQEPKLVKIETSTTASAHDLEPSPSPTTAYSSVSVAPGGSADEVCASREPEHSPPPPRGRPLRVDRPLRGTRRSVSYADAAPAVVVVREAASAPAAPARAEGLGFFDYMAVSSVANAFARANSAPPAPEVHHHHHATPAYSGPVVASSWSTAPPPPRTSWSSPAAPPPASPAAAETVTKVGYGKVTRR